MGRRETTKTAATLGAVGRPGVAVGGMAALALAGCLGATSGCGSNEPARPLLLPRAEPGAASTSAAARPENVVLVTIDGARWQEIFGGVDARLAENALLPRSAAVGPRALLPNLYRLFFDAGTVLGDPRLPGGIAASGPVYISLPGYAELLGGRSTSCRSNDCEPGLETTLADDIARAAGAPSGSAAVLGSWEVVARVASAGTHLVEVQAGRAAGDAAPAYPGHGAYRPDHVTSALAARRLLDRPRFLWIALGDPDEWAHRGDYRGYLEALRAADRFIGELAHHLEEMGEYGARTVVVVTTDHGRDAGFKDHGGEDSAAVWLLARGAGIARRGVIGTAERRHLRDVTPTLRELLGLRPRSCEACGAPIPELLQE